jgi:type II secretory pathway pseudopilin PulG
MRGAVRHLRPRTRPKAHLGFTLVETACATAILAVSVMAVMGLSFACTQQNRTSTQLATATLLATHLREILSTVSFSDPSSGTTTWGPEAGETLSSYDDLDDFDDASYMPPIDVNRATIASLDDYQQRVFVRPINAKDLQGNIDGTAIADGTYTGAVRITIQVLYRDPVTRSSAVVHEVSWVRVDN